MPVPAEHVRHGEPLPAARVCCRPHPFERRSNLDTSVAVNEKARRYRLESPHEAAIIYACLDVNIIVGGFEKRHLNFVPGVAGTSAIGLGLCELSNDVGRCSLHPGESFLRQEFAHLSFCHVVSQWQLKLATLLMAADASTRRGEQYVRPVGPLRTWGTGTR